MKNLSNFLYDICDPRGWKSTSRNVLKSVLCCNIIVPRITIKENVEAFIVASKDNGLEVNVDKTKYMVMSRDQNAGRSHTMKDDNSSIEWWKSSNICQQT